MREESRTGWHTVSRWATVPFERANPTTNLPAHTIGEPDDVAVSGKRKDEQIGSEAKLEAKQFESEVDLVQERRLLGLAGEFGTDESGEQVSGVTGQVGSESAPVVPWELLDTACEFQCEGIGITDNGEFVGHERSSQGGRSAEAYQPDLGEQSFGR